MAESTLAKDEIKLLNHYKKELRTNNVPTDQDLKNYAKRNSLKISNYSKIFKHIRSNVEESAYFSQLRNVKFHQTVTIDNLGLLSADFGFYKKEDKWYNKNNIGFLMVVCVSTGKRHAIPMKNRKMSSFEDALENLCLGNVYPVINCVISDRESAVFSEKFQAKMKKKYNIKFAFMYRMNKAWSAENSLRHVKEELSQVMDTKPDNKRWIDVLDFVIAAHNRKKIADTGYSANDINDLNFFDFLNALNKTDDVTMNYNTNSISFESIPHNKWRKQTLKIDVGDKVLASFKSLEGTKIMQKPSVDGTYSRKMYIVADGFLRNTKKNDDVVPGNIKLLIFLSSRCLLIMLFFFQFTCWKTSRKTLCRDFSIRNN